MQNSLNKKPIQTTQDTVEPLTKQEVTNSTALVYDTNISAKDDQNLSKISKAGVFLESFFTNTLHLATTQIKNILQKAEKIVQDDYYIPISEESVNGLLERFVVAKVRAISLLEVSLQQDDFILNGVIETSGIKADVSGQFEVVNITMNAEKQFLVFRQIGSTNIDSIYYDSIKTKIFVKMGLLVLKIIKRDPLGFILERYNIATIMQKKLSKNLTVNSDTKVFINYGDEITIDLNKYFKNDKATLKNLQRFQVSHAKVHNTRLEVLSRINLEGFTQS